MTSIKTLLNRLFQKPACVHQGCNNHATKLLHTQDGHKLRLCEKHYEEWVEKGA